jgi:hypothetical protein
VDLAVGATDSLGYCSYGFTLAVHLYHLGLIQHQLGRHHIFLSLNMELYFLVNEQSAQWRLNRRSALDF